MNKITVLISVFLIYPVPFIYAQEDEINYDSIYAFVQNYFTVSLPGSSVTMEPNNIREIEIIMNIESWFDTPHHFDFNVWGGAIMEIQPAVQMAKENGFDVFSIGYIR